MSLVKNYNLIDKALHYLAFSIPGLQSLLADLENDLYESKLSKIELSNEVFITGLPRSGTTLLLDFLYKTDEFCTFSYRHMPFILTPLFWKKLTSPFSKESKDIERAHGDGMKVSFDSPEAFEEVIWLNYLKNTYVKSDRIIPLSTKTTSKRFAKQLQSTIKKLILEQQIQVTDSKQSRYLSKNNLNCSRLSVISTLFPDAKVLVPFREPMSHVGSLMKQHKLFNNMHADDKFAKKYMQWLGHYDFGENFKPIDFDCWLDNYSGNIDYNDESFWLSYWVASYSNILQHISNNVHLIDYNKILSEPEKSFQSIADILSIENKSRFIDFSKQIREPTSKPSKTTSVDTKILDTANKLYSKLQRLSI